MEIAQRKTVSARSEAIPRVEQNLDKQRLDLEQMTRQPDLEIVATFATKLAPPRSSVPVSRSLKEEEVWTAEYRSMEEARNSIGGWIEEYNHDRPHRGVGNRTPHEAFLAFSSDLSSEVPTVPI